MSTPWGTRFYLAWLVSLVATLGGLYLSELRELPPSALTWYARTLMFPLALVIGIALFRQEFWMRRYVRWLALPGLLVSLFHTLVYWGVSSGGRICLQPRCDAQITMSGDPATGLDAMLTHPLVSVLLFALILFLMSGRESQQTEARA